MRTLALLVLALLPVGVASAAPTETPLVLFSGPSADGARDWIDCGTEYDMAIVDRVDHTHHCEKVVRR